MADLLRALGGIFDGVNQAVCSVFHLVGAFGRLNSAFIDGVIKAANDCSFAVSMIGTSLSSALLEILCYIADFFLEVFHVLYSCIKVVSKIGLLIYMLCSSLLQALSIILQWFMQVALAIARYCYNELFVVGFLFREAWQWFRAAVFQASSATKEALVSVGNQTLATSQKAAQSTTDFLKVVSEGVADQYSELVGAISHNLELFAKSLMTFLVDTWSCITSKIHDTSSQLLTFPGRLVSQDVQESLQEYFPNVELTFYDLLVILLIPSGTIFMVRFVVSYLNQKGLTFVLFQRPRPARIRPPFRPPYFVDSSDEDPTEDYLNGADALEESEDEEEFGGTDQDAIAVFAAGEIDYDDSDDYSYEEENSEVEEFEVATDSEESDSTDDIQIKVELPQTGSYNLRERHTSEDLVFREKLSPEQLEKVLENERDRRICVVCTDQPKTVVVLPCKHMCLCINCAHEIVRQRSARRVCPLCRSRFNTVMHIYA